MRPHRLQNHKFSSAVKNKKWDVWKKFILCILKNTKCYGTKVGHLVSSLYVKVYNKFIGKEIWLFFKEIQIDLKNNSFPSFRSENRWGLTILCMFKCRILQEKDWWKEMVYYTKNKIGKI